MHGGKERERDARRERERERKREGERGGGREGGKERIREVKSFSNKIATIVSVSKFNSVHIKLFFQQPIFFYFSDSDCTK